MRYRSTAILFCILLFVCLTTAAVEKRQLRKKTFSPRDLVSGSKRALPSALNELQQQTLDSIEKIDDYPAYTITYYADYEFDEYLKTGTVIRGAKLIWSASGIVLRSSR